MWNLCYYRKGKIAKTLLCKLCCRFWNHASTCEKRGKGRRSSSSSLNSRLWNHGPCKISDNVPVALVGASSCPWCVRTALQWKGWISHVNPQDLVGVTTGQRAWFSLLKMIHFLMRGKGIFPQVRIQWIFPIRLWVNMVWLNNEGTGDKEGATRVYRCGPQAAGPCSPPLPCAMCRSDLTQKCCFLLCADQCWFGVRCFVSLHSKPLRYLSVLSARKGS